MAVPTPAARLAPTGIPTAPGTLVLSAYFTIPLVGAHLVRTSFGCEVPARRRRACFARSRARTPMSPEPTNTNRKDTGAAKSLSWNTR